MTEADHYRLWVAPRHVRFWISDCLVLDLRKESVREQLLSYFSEIVGPKSDTSVPPRNYNLFNPRVSKVITDAKGFLSMQYRIDSEHVRGLRYIEGNKEFNNDLKEFYRNILELKQLIDHFSFQNPPGLSEQVEVVEEVV